MSAALIWLRLDVGRRWKSLVVLTLLVAFAGGVVLTAFAGAHRGDSAMPRLRDQTLPVDALAVANIPGFDWTPIDQLPYVVASTHFVLAATPKIQQAQKDKVLEDSIDFLRDDDTWMRTMERPVVLDGRMLDFDDPSEAVITGDWGESDGLGVGSTIQVRLPTPDQADTGATDDMAYDDYAGPTITVHIVGKVVTPWAVQDGGGGGAITLSPALFSTYRANIMGATGKAGWENAGFRLEHGAADIPRLRADIERISGKSIDVWDYDAGYDHLEAIGRHEAGFLAAFGLAAVVAAVVLVGQAIGRYAAAATTELDTARALGMTPRQVLVAATVNPIIAGGVGALLAALAAVASSPWFPLGSARAVEPEPGVRVDWAVLPVGFLAIIALVVAGAVVSSASAARRSVAGKARVSTTAATAANADAPVPLVVGIRFALERGTGRSAVPVRPALVGALFGVLGVVAVGVLSHGINDAADHPERFGQTYQAMGFVGYGGHDFLPSAPVVDALDELPEVTGVNDSRGQVADLPHGQGSLQLWSWSPGTKPLGSTVLSGRMPETADEVALGSGSLDYTGLHVGDTISLTSGDRSRRLHIVGEVFLPTGPHNDYDEGGWITDNGYDTLFTDYKFHVLHIALAPSYQDDAGIARLNSDILAAEPKLQELATKACRGSTDPTCMSVVTPLEDLDVRHNGTVQVLEEVRRLPVALAAFLVLLAIGAIGHALATAVRRRAVDLAVLRALGLTPAQSRLVVVVQACVLALFGLAFGVPIGVALGRTAWRWVAGFTPVQYLPPTPVLVLLLVAPAALLVVNVLAALPARRAGRARLAAVLRAE
ncbi:FtsX-like permease family protein [Nocardioides panacisoli]|uniref:ABC3 transporter permease C-terminal domain-containing protein n=1 Tax=Nocardioides panacisoli TaxID=627624 RepID=A0ABP7J378_9ACTN